MTSKKDLSERDICTQFILPALIRAGWDLEKQIREEVFFNRPVVFLLKVIRLLGVKESGQILYYI